MIDLAERIAQGFDFLRVDLYQVEERIYFGEITVYPNAGLAPFQPAEWDRKLGDWWRKRRQATIEASPRGSGRW
jgi:hypothetical protein